MNSFSSSGIASSSFELRSNISLVAFDFCSVSFHICMLHLTPFVMLVAEFLLPLCQCVACYLNCAGSSETLNGLSLHFSIKLLVFKTFPSLTLSYLSPPVSHYSVKHHFHFASVCTISWFLFPRQKSHLVQHWENT